MIRHDPFTRVVATPRRRRVEATPSSLMVLPSRVLPAFPGDGGVAATFKRRGVATTS